MQDVAIEPLLHRRQASKTVVTICEKVTKTMWTQCSSFKFYLQTLFWLLKNTQILLFPCKHFCLNWGCILHRMSLRRAFDSLDASYRMWLNLPYWPSVSKDRTVSSANNRIWWSNQELLVIQNEYLQYYSYNGAKVQLSAALVCFLCHVDRVSLWSPIDNK